MNFLQNPFQLKFLPVLVALAVGVAFWAITGEVKCFAILGVMAGLQFVAADKPVHPLLYHGYIALTAVFLAMAVYMAFVGAWAAVGVAWAIALLPLSVVLTRRPKA